MLNKKKLYIREAVCISAQDTFRGDGANDSLCDAASTPFSLRPLAEKNKDQNYASAIDPDFKAYIPVRKLRRMCTITRRGLLASLQLLKWAKMDEPDAIIVGTGLGCLHETFSFLDIMIQEKEAFVNPSYFIQSTHNTIAGQIALMLKCTNYNLTFSQKQKSFESALIDAWLLFNEGEVNNVLLGGMDELDTRLVDKMSKLPCYRGKVLSEGAAFFLLDKEIAEVEVVACTVSFGPKFDPLAVLAQYHMEDIDLFIYDEQDDLDGGFSLKQEYSDKYSIDYQQIFGTYDTVVSSAVWLGYTVLKNQSFPQGIPFDIEQKGEIKNCAIYTASADNQSLILLRHVS